MAVVRNLEDMILFPYQFSTLAFASRLFLNSNTIESGSGTCG